MRIVYLSKLAPQLGVRRILEVGKRFVAWGHQVTVVSAATTREQPFEEVVDGIRMVALRTAPPSFRRNDRIGFLITRMPYYVMGPRFVRAGGAGPLDILVEDVAPLRSPITGSVATALGVPLVLQVHSVFPTLGNWIRAYGIKGIIGVLNERWLRHGRDYHGLYSDAPWALRSLARDIGERVPTRWIQNGVDVEQFRPPKAKPLTGNRIKLLAVGRLVGLKNLDVLIQAVRGLERDFTLTVVGDGPMRGQLDKLVSRLGLTEAVALRGRVNDDELVRAYQEADVFVHPSLVEGMPHSVLEAMASGLPVVMNDIDAAATIVRPEFSWLARSVDVPAWRDALAQVSLLSRAELRDRGMHARRLCETQFTWEVAARRELEFLQEVSERSVR